jgi:VWFA-related protein
MPFGIKQPSARAKRLIAVLMCSLLVPLCHEAQAGAGAQDVTATQQQIRVVYQITDVTVLNAGGEYVRGLTKGDFILMVDGKAVEIKSVDEFTAPDAGDERVARYVAWIENNADQGGEEPPQPPTQPRSVIMVFDRFNMGEAGTKASIESARRIVKESLLPYDRVAVFAYNGTMKTLTGPTTDRDRILEAIDRTAMVNQNSHYRPSVFELIPPTERSEIWEIKIILQEKSADFRKYVDSLRILTDSLGALPGRKTYLLFSEGPNLYNPYSPEKMARKLGTGESADSDENTDSKAILTAGGYLSPNLAAAELSELSRRISSTNASVYTIRRGHLQPEWMLTMDIDTAGRMDGDFTATLQMVANDMHNERLDVLRTAANLTNGKFYDAGMPDERLVENLRAEIGNYYLLGFAPPAGKEGGYHRIEIETRNPDYRVIHREGFFEPKNYAEMRETEKAIHLEEGFLDPEGIDELGLIARAYRLPLFGRHQALAAFTLDTGKIGRTGKGLCELEMVINVEDLKGRIRHRIHRAFVTKDKSLPTKLWLSENLPLLEDGCYAYLAVRDTATGRRATWKEYFGPQADSTSIVSLADPLMLSNDLRGNIAKWKLENVYDGVAVSERIPTVDMKIRARPLIDNAVTQGDDAVVVIALGNLPKELNPSKMNLSIEYQLDAREDESYILVASREDSKYAAEHRLLVITATVPVGLAQRRSGILSLSINGLFGSKILIVTLPYRISDYSPAKAAELLKDHRINPVP